MRASATSIDITPERPVQLGASAAGRHPWRGVSEPLEAQLLVMRDDDDEPVLFVTLDLLYPGRLVRQAVEDAAGLPAERVVVAASHTHRAPMTDDTKPALGRPDPEYVDWLLTRLRDAVRHVLHDVRSVPVELGAASGEAMHSINRRLRKKFVLARRPRFNEVVNAPSPDGFVDETVTAAVVRRADGSPMAAMWSYACHPVGFPHLNTIAAHYPHVVRERIRHTLGRDDLPVLFFQGFSGNTRPRASARVHTFSRRLRRVVVGPLFEDMTPQDYETWSGSLADVVADLVASTQPCRSGRLRAGRAVMEPERFAHPLEVPVTFSVIRLGDDLALAGISAEPVAEYGPVVRERLGSRDVLLAGCTDHPFGYAPTRQILEEGGYEAGGFCASFGLEAVNPDIEASVIRGFDVAVAASGVPLRGPGGPR